MSRERHQLPREFTDGVWWLGGCLESAAFAEPVHFHTSAYLIVGRDRTLLYDTAPPAMWPELDRDLDRILGDRPLDIVVASHPEIPHAGNFGKLLDKYPSAVAMGDLRDYHLYFPDHVDRMRQVAHDTTLDLGGGYKFTFLDAIIEDLPNTVWGYEHKQQVLFPVDGFGYGHHPQNAEDFDEPVHRAGECALLSSELKNPPELDLATYLTQSSLFWSRYVEITPFLDRFLELTRKYPTKYIAPAHGSVIDDLDVVMPVMREAHRKSFIG